MSRWLENAFRFQAGLALHWEAFVLQFVLVLGRDLFRAFVDLNVLLISVIAKE